MSKLLSVLFASLFAVASTAALAQDNKTEAKKDAKAAEVKKEDAKAADAKAAKKEEPKKKKEKKGGC